MTTSRPFDLRLPTPGCYNDPERAGLDAKSVFDGMTEHLFFTLGKLAPTASRHDLYMALSYAVRDRLMMRYLATIEAGALRVVVTTGGRQTQIEGLGGGHGGSASHGAWNHRQARGARSPTQ